MYIVGYVPKNRIEQGWLHPCPQPKVAYIILCFFVQQVAVTHCLWGTRGGRRAWVSLKCKRIEENCWILICISLNKKRIPVTKRHINLLYSLLIFKLWIYFCYPVSHSTGFCFELDRVRENNYEKCHWGKRVQTLMSNTHCMVSVLSLVISVSLLLTSMIDEAVILCLEKLDFGHLALTGFKDVPNSALKHYLLFQILWTMQPPLRIQTK